MKFHFFPAVVIFTLVAASCKKNSYLTSSSGNQQDSLSLLLQGTWNITSHIAAGLPDNLANDTTVPVHSESFIFSHDTLYSDSWYSGNLNIITSPATFSVTQSMEFRDTTLFTAASNYFIADYSNMQDTFYVYQITSTNLELEQNITAVGFDLITTFSK